MDPLPVIFDISSDDEPCYDEPKADDYDWLSEILKSVDKPPEDDDSDDVVVVSEVNPRKKAKLSKPVEKDDDDCVILDGDPDKPVGVVNEPDSGSDELVIVGEKGQVACRDYPHPRHHCAKFPFSSTPHERHCDLCHCYVCDSIAPCIHWGKGSSNIDHCHANEKEEIWKLQRKSFKQVKNAPLSDLRLPNSLSKSLPQLNQASQVNQIRRMKRLLQLNSVPPSTVIRSTSNSIIQNQVNRPTPIRACTSSANPGIPSVRSQGRGYLPRHISVKNRTQHHLVSQQLLGLSNDVMRKERDPNTGNLGAQFDPSHKPFQRSGSIGGVLPMNRSVFAHTYSINDADALQQSGSLPSMETFNDRSIWLDTRPNINLESGTNQNSPETNLGNIYLNAVPSQPQVQSQPITQSNDGQNIYQHVNQIQNVTDPSFSDSQFQSNLLPPVENFQLQSVVPEYEPLPIKESNSQFPGSSNVSLPDFEFENWLMENESLPGIPGGSGPPIDAGMLYFDFETSWNGLTHA